MTLTFLLTIERTELIRMKIEFGDAFNEFFQGAISELHKLI